MTATLDPTGYAPTAYRSNRKTPEPAETSQQSTLFRKSWTMGSPLPKGKLSGVYPPNFLKTWGPKEVREDEENLHRFKAEAEAGGEPFNPVGWINGDSIRYATLPRISWALLWMQHGGRLLFTWLFPIFVFVWLVMWFMEPGEISLTYFFSDAVLPIFLYFFSPMLLCWGIGRFLEKKYPKVVYQELKGPLWELNRRTGMVTLFENPEKDGQSGEIRAQAPFHEWDGYLLSLPDHQGNIWYRLVLVHKTQEWALPMNQLLAATTNREDVLAYSDLIRQYMDVTKSLPDIPLFEAYRHLDLTTRAQDEKKGRDPLYWRNMNEEDYDAFKRKNRTDLGNHSWR
ncbi:MULTISPECIES: hypothetical protein [unclassified Marinobacter]|uniref:hypothetical protein n=1 Tax=unclassified Marinobacter TaxID=83889 RepID=UPI00200F31C8|nr:MULTISPECIES: hypothetical protein [unclassified Marinobacter]MCL1481425.1 hypothetical protein [Marinobacter sp.]UQG54527.1 hypothetical protein MIH16_13900 [Marinobacter sp. M4C]UQG63332.1 hypothetical protein MIH17_13895 [Marinobacter sp. M2C]UQG67612.1 hypothetical protein MIH19_13900 [Marinobacter sp. M1C]